jgi:hypothetical protein
MKLEGEWSSLMHIMDICEFDNSNENTFLRHHMKTELKDKCRIHGVFNDFIPLAAIFSVMYLCFLPD